MTNHDRMIRTLIVCFVLLMAALVPLRFVEVNQIGQDVKVLGEETVNEEVIVLPNAEINP